ncbi:MAG: hypothetical protein IJD57_00645 [Candidatus Gastranaerophilales bacterium]|nr:hypothetical protein [Candidatus Gastranaerophilales bacterium]
MINKKLHSRIPEYITTVFLSVVVMFFICLAVEMDLLYKVEERVYKEAFSMASLAKFSSIDALQKKLLTEPNNYMIYIKLAHIHEDYSDFKKANQYYEKALKLSNKSNFSLYNYAIFLAKQKFYTLSATFAEDLILHNKKAIEYKAKIYETMADKMEADGEYLAATKAYQVAHKYAKSLHGKEFYEQISKKYSTSCIELADINVQDKKIEEAIMNLKNSLKIYETDVAKYKLALIYKDTNTKEAYKLLADVFKKNPFMVNPYILNEVLEDLIAQAKSQGNISLADFYIMKKNRFEKQLKEEYIYKGDLTIENAHIVVHKPNIFSKKHYFLKFDLKNNTKTIIENLYFEFEVYINDKKYDAKKHIITSSNKLGYYEEMKDIEISLPLALERKLTSKKQHAIIKYYARKKKIAPWILLKIEGVNI